MSVYGVEDQSVGLPLFDLSCAPSIAALKLPYLRVEQRSASVRRIYQSFMGSRLCRGGTAIVARTTNVTVAFDAVLVADVHTGFLKHQFPLKGDSNIKLKVLTCANWVGVQVTAENGGGRSGDEEDAITVTGGDLLIQIPALDDQTRLVDCMKALVKHHSGGTASLAVGEVESVEEMRHLCLGSVGQKMPHVGTPPPPTGEVPKCQNGHPANFEQNRPIGWSCDTCRSHHDAHSKGSYRCPHPCDYDMCKACWDRLRSRPVPKCKKGHPVKLEENLPLSSHGPPGGWTCDTCLTRDHHHSEGSHRCHPCDFDMCKACWDRLSSKKTDDDDSTNLPVPGISRQLWSVLNRSSPITLDRMRHVKTKFATLDQETMQDVTIITKSSDETIKATKKEKREYRKKIEELEKAIEEEKRRQGTLNVQDAKIAATKEEYSAATTNFEHHAVQFALEEQNWQLLLTTKQQEELKQKTALTTQERSNRRHVEETVDETTKLENQAVDVKVARDLYTSSDYKGAVDRRDRAIVELEHATMDLEKEQSPKVQHRRRQVIESIEEELKTQDALRRLRLETVKQIENEIQTHTDLISDITHFDSEIEQFNDADLLLQVKQSQTEDNVEILRQKIAAVKKSNTEMKEKLAASAADRPLYVVTRSKLDQSMRRRQMVEESCVSQEKERQSRKTELNQKIFDVKLRVAALKRHLE